MVVLLAGFCLPYRLNAQSCDPEADFTFSVSGCNAGFLPLYNGPGTVVHNWKFYSTASTVGLYSSSSVPSPIFTFVPVVGSTSRYVVHTVTITLPSGGVVIKTCIKNVLVNCTDIESCYEKNYFYYQVSGCTVAITLGLGAPATWDFGDLTPPVTAALPSHTYAAGGTYVVTVTFNGQSCSLRIRVDCEESSGCCDAAFDAAMVNDCGVLRLILDAKCNNGAHRWSIMPSVSGGSISLVNFFSSLPDQTVQVTNINTYLVSNLVIEHTIICEDGQEFTETITIALPTTASGTPLGIFIGRDEVSPSNLTDFNGVLPGSSIIGPLTVHVSGIVRINKTFTFHAMDIQFHEGLTGFDMLYPGAPLTLEACNLHTSCPCLWRGLQVSNRGLLTCNSNTVISDALYAIRILSGSRGSVTLDEVSFEDNFIGIRRTGTTQATLIMQRTAFDGIGPLLDICSLTHDIEAPARNGNYGIQPMQPVVFYPERGFAGMYMEKGPLNLDPLAASLHNSFSNMAYGVIVYDGDVSIKDNSEFSNIGGGPYYGLRQTAGVLFVDRDPGGPNTFILSDADFTKCEQGMHIRSEQAAAPTNIGITYANMTDVRTGIFLDARLAGGEFFGTGEEGDFVGVKYNKIGATLTYPLLVSNGGISFLDFSPGFSQVDISENEVDINYVLNGGGSAGIAANGLAMVSDPGPSGVEADLHDNRVTLTNGGEIGMGMSSHPNGWIRNNRNESGNGHGIFINGNARSGITINLEGNNNLVACNEVTLSAGSGAVRGLLNVFQCPNGQYLRNVLTGPDAGAYFQFYCFGTEFRCNDMVDNTIGLVYDDYAITGDQGTPTVTNGNRWLGTLFSGGADADVSTLLVSDSRYYVRGGNETPPPIVNPSTGWFFPASPTATIACLLDNCPAPAPRNFALLSRITPLDTLVAQGLAVPDKAPYAEGQQWQQEYQLWRKLKDHPDLTQGNAVMQEFLAAFAGSNIEALWQVQVNMRNMLVPSADLLSLIQSNREAIMQTEAQLWVLDSLLAVATEPNQVTALEQQSALQDSFLTIQVLAQEAVCGEFETQRTMAIAGLLEQLTTINPENISEANLRRTYEIYLQTFASDLEAIGELLTELESVAIQCPLEGGPGVSVATSMYKGFTGLLPVQGSCGNIEGRGKQNFLSSTVLSLYPNPNQGGFVVNIPIAEHGQHALLRILNAQGSLVQSIAVNGEQTVTFDLNYQPNGLYFVSLLGHGRTTKPLPFVIKH